MWGFFFFFFNGICSYAKRLSEDGLEESAVLKLPSFCGSLCKGTFQQSLSHLFTNHLYTVHDVGA